MTDSRTIAWRWIEAAVGGDGETLRTLFAPDCRIFIAGDMPFCGWMNVDGFFGQTSILPLAGPITFEVGEMVAEGDRIWFEAQSHAQLKNGADYRNIYIFQLRITDERIVEYKEFGDTLHIWRVIEDPQTRGPAIPRQPLLTIISRAFVGNAIGESGRGDVNQPESLSPSSR